jgi:hypothetical protein
LKPAGRIGHIGGIHAHGFKSIMHGLFTKSVKVGSPCVRFEQGVVYALSQHRSVHFLFLVFIHDYNLVPWIDLSRFPLSILFPYRPPFETAGISTGKKM